MESNNRLDKLQRSKNLSFDEKNIELFKQREDVLSKISSIKDKTDITDRRKS